MGTVKRSVNARGGGQGGLHRWRPEDFLGNETILYDTTMVDTYHYIFVHIHRLSNTRNEPQYKLWTPGENDVSM